MFPPEIPDTWWVGPLQCLSSFGSMVPQAQSNPVGSVWHSTHADSDRYPTRMLDFASTARALPSLDSRFATAHSSSCTKICIDPECLLASGKGLIKIRIDHERRKTQSESVLIRLFSNSVRKQKQLFTHILCARTAITLNATHKTQMMRIDIVSPLATNCSPVYFYKFTLRSRAMQ